jgi:hypothetical protein
VESEMGRLQELIDNGTVSKATGLDNSPQASQIYYIY